MIEQLLGISNRFKVYILLIIYLYMLFVLWLRIWLSIESNSVIKDSTRLDWDNEIYLYY